MKKSAMTLSFYLLCLLLPSAYSSCNSQAFSTEKDEPPSTIANGGLPSSRDLVTNVETLAAEKKPFRYLINTNGKIKSLHDRMITCTTGGMLASSKARTGSAFAAGTPILELETTSLTYKLEREELTRFNAEKEYASQLLAYDNLLKDKSNDQAAAVQKKLRISTGLAAAEQDIRETTYELNQSVIRAPFGGVLSDVKIHEGDPVRSGQELFRIYDPANLVLEIKILEADIGLLKTGTAAEVSPISNSAARFRASVYEINPYVDENGMVLVTLKIDQAGMDGPALLPGMNGIAEIKIPMGKALVVPRQAVVTRNDKSVVFTCENGKAKWNYVTTGRENGEEVEIKEGLTPGQKVIISNNQQLAHGSPVTESTGKKSTGDQ